MLKDLLEGIVVPPTIGGQPRLSLPKVIGITVSPGEGDGSNIVIEIQPIEVETRGLPSTTTLAGDPDNEVSVPSTPIVGDLETEFMNWAVIHLQSELTAPGAETDVSTIVRNYLSDLEVRGRFVDASPVSERDTLRERIKVYLEGGGRIQRSFPVIEFNIGDYMNIEGLEPPYNVSLLKVTEKKYNRDGNLYTPDNPYLTMDENGNVKYTPRGLFRDNILYLDVEIVGGGAPLSAPAKKRRRVYEPKPSKNIAGAPEAPEGVAGRPGNAGDEEEEELRKVPIFDQVKKEEVTIILTDNTIGKSVEDVEAFHLYQGMDTTCMIASAGMLLNTIGIRNEDGSLLSYEDVLDLFAVKINPDTGEIIGDLPPIVDRSGKPGFTQWVVETIELKIKDYIVPADPRESLIPVYENIVKRTKKASLGLTSLPGKHSVPSSVYEAIGDPYSVLFDGIAAHFPHLKVENGHFANDVVSFIAHLAAGKSFWIAVDDNELDNNVDAFGNIIETGLGVFTGGPNHAVVVHGMEQDINGNWWVVVNDSNQLKFAKNRRDGTSLVPIKMFFAAFEDSRMRYMSIENTEDPNRNPLNISITNIERNNERKETFERLISGFLFRLPEYESIRAVTDGTIESKIKHVLMTPELLKKLFAVDFEPYPDIDSAEHLKSLIETYQTDMNSVRDVLQQAFPELDISKIEDVWLSVQ